MKSGTICHAAQPELDTAIARVKTRRMGPGETWEHDLRVDVTPVVAVAAAAFKWGVLGSAPYDVLESVR